MNVNHAPGLARRRKAKKYQPTYSKIVRSGGKKAKSR